MIMDPIGDMLTRIRNANALNYSKITIPSSKIKVEIAKILKDEGFINNYVVDNKIVKKMLIITLKYGLHKEKVISGLKRISKPGLRITSDYNHLPRVLKGLGIAIISTSKGIMTDSKARELKVGGEILAYIW